MIGERICIPIEKLRFSNHDLLHLFLPLVIEQGLEYCVGLADSMMVAQVGEAAVSGVSLVDFVMALLISVFSALAGGGAVIVGQYLGMKDETQAGDAARQMTKVSLLLSIAVMVAVYAARPLILNHLFGSITPEVRAAAGTYFMIVVASIPFLALYNCGAAVFRTKGNSALPMRIMAWMNGLNVVCNAVLVLGLHWGVAGVAIPTLISRIGAAALILFYAEKERDTLCLRGFLHGKLQKRMVQRILGVGAPFGFENGMFYLGRLIVLSIVSLFGTASIAANSVAGTIIMFEALPGMAINLGLAVIISQCVGSGDYEQAQYYAKKVIRIVHACFVLSAALVIAAMPLLMRIYQLSPEATQLTWLIVLLHGVLQVLIWPYGYVLPVIFRGAGDAKFPMIVSIASMLLARILLAYVFAVFLGLGMMGTWYAMFVDWIVKAMIYIRHYCGGKWMNRKAI